MPILGLIASSTRQGQSTITGAMEPIASVVVPSGGLASITFGSIPQTYTHLQIRYSGTSLYPLISSNLGAGTTGHYLYGTGASALGYNFAPLAGGMYVSIDGNAGDVSAGVIDILDFANTNKNKTFSALHGRETNTADSSIVFASGFWNSTSAITSITITNNVAGSVPFAQYSSFALYGIKGI